MARSAFRGINKFVGAVAFGAAAIGFASGAAAQAAIDDGDTLKLQWGYSAGWPGVANTHDSPNANGGGAFYATVLSGDAAGQSFFTFCVERNEYFSIGQTLTVQHVNTAAVNGGLSGGNPDPLDARTAYLYTQFWGNALTDTTGELYGRGTADPDDKANGEALQLAIWKIEGEWADSLAGQALAWYNEASAAVSGGGWSGIGQVRVLNLITTDAAGTVTYKQDQLYITPVPEPETYALLLAGLGMMGFIARRRAAPQAA